MQFVHWNYMVYSIVVVKISWGGFRPQRVHMHVSYRVLQIYWMYLRTGNIRFSYNTLSLYFVIVLYTLL